MQPDPVCSRRPTRGWWKITFRVLALLGVLYVGGCLFVYLRQEQFIFVPPSNYPDNTPATNGLAFEDLHIPVDKTQQVHAWWIPAAEPTNKVVIYFHGNAYTIEMHVDESQRLHELGTNVLTVEYRGYGSSSPGQEDERRTAEDARAVMEYLIQKRRIPKQRIIICGRSLGTGVATQLAVEYPSAAGLVLVSPFTSTADMVALDSAGQFFPGKLFTRNRFQTISKISSLHLPLLIVVGTDDQETPPWMAKSLMARANEPKQLYVVPGAGHNDTWQKGGAELIRHIAEFVSALPS